MAITTAMCTSFKSELLNKEHDIDTDTLKVALYTNAATLGASTTAYSATNEVPNGSGYTTGGATLAGAAISTDGTTAIVDFTDTVWSASTITARGCMIYNSSAANKAIAVFDFGADIVSTGGDFTIQWPAAAAATATIRI